MSTSDDIPPSESDDFPPPVREVVDKLDNKNELSEYLNHLSAYHTHHLSDLTQELQERLLLQGLDEDDLYNLHEFLAVEFENGLLRTGNKKLTETRVGLLQKRL